MNADLTIQEDGWGAVLSVVIPSLVIGTAAWTWIWYQIFKRPR
jgi:hypothetical protein